MYANRPSALGSILSAKSRSHYEVCESRKVSWVTHAEVDPRSEPNTAVEES